MDALDLRSRVIADCDAGLGTKEVAEKYKVSQSWVRKLKQIRRETGQIGPRRSAFLTPASSTDTWQLWSSWWNVSRMPPSASYVNS